ncbi:hypothetical protein LBMAG55_02250 [Verrucomicrobiota bacterium]|nr:hypothetical protein LBMAG55_02250 [Verrucomicrobiota bacterium]
MDEATRARGGQALGVDGLGGGEAQGQGGEEQEVLHGGVAGSLNPLAGLPQARFHEKGRPVGALCGSLA